MNTGFENRFVVAIGTFMPVASSAVRNCFTMRSRSGRARTGRHEIVVVEVHSVRAEIREALHCIDRVERRSRFVTEGVAPTIADGPEAERELVGRLGFVRRHMPMFPDGRVRGNMRG